MMMLVPCDGRWLVLLVLVVPTVGGIELSSTTTVELLLVSSSSTRSIVIVHYYLDVDLDDCVELLS